MTKIIDINHETGDLSQYGGSSTGGGKMSVTAAAALAGTGYGIAYQLTGGTTTYYAYKDVTANTSGKLRLRFYLDPNSLTMGASDTFAVIYCDRTTAGAYVLRLMLTMSGGAYKIYATIYEDSGATSTVEYTITDAPHYVEMYLIRATNSTSSDGSLALYLDGVLLETISGKDNYDRFRQFTRTWVCCDGPDAGTSGTWYFDELVINDDGSEIGPVAAAGIPKHFMNYQRGRTV